MFTLYNGNTQILLAAQACSLPYQQAPHRSNCSGALWPQVLFEVSPAGRVVPDLRLQAFDRDPVLLNGQDGVVNASFRKQVILDDCVEFTQSVSVAYGLHPPATQVAFVFLLAMYILLAVAVRKKVHARSANRFAHTSAFPRPCCSPIGSCDRR